MKASASTSPRERCDLRRLTPSRTICAIVESSIAMYLDPARTWAGSPSSRGTRHSCFSRSSCRETSVDGYGGHLGIEIPLKFVDRLPSLLSERVTAFLLA